MDNPVVGIWTTAARRSTVIKNPDGTTDHSGNWVQSSRLGMPLVNEVVVPVGLKNYFNGRVRRMTSSTSAPSTTPNSLACSRPLRDTGSRLERDEGRYPKSRSDLGVPERRRHAEPSAQR